MSAPYALDRSRRLLLATSLASVVLWFVPGAFLLIYPIRLFVTFVHEGGHAIMTVMTGGHVLDIQLDAAGNGLTQSNGGMPVLIYPAGYVGATALGGLLLLMARPRQGRAVLAILAGAMALVTLLWVRNPFGIAVGVGWCLLLLTIRRLASPTVSDFVSSFLAVQLCLNAVLDVRMLWYLTTDTSVPNDAVFMANHYGLTPWFWAGLWAGCAVAILLACLRRAWSSRRT